MRAGSPVHRLGERQGLARSIPGDNLGMLLAGAYVFAGVQAGSAPLHYLQQALTLASSIDGYNVSGELYDGVDRETMPRLAEDVAEVVEDLLDSAGIDRELGAGRERALSERRGEVRPRRGSAQDLEAAGRHVLRFERDLRGICA